MNTDAIYKQAFVYHGATARVTDVIWQSIEGGLITADRGVKTFWRTTKYDQAEWKDCRDTLDYDGKR